MFILDVRLQGGLELTVEVIRTPILFTVSDSDTGAFIGVFDPLFVLSAWQARAIVGKPELVLLTAHLIARKHAGVDFENVAVRAKTWISLNGRKPRMQVDPNVDLASKQRSILTADWILR